MLRRCLQKRITACGECACSKARRLLGLEISGAVGKDFGGIKGSLGAIDLAVGAWFLVAAVVRVSLVLSKLPGSCSP